MRERPLLPRLGVEFGDRVWPDFDELGEIGEVGVCIPAEFGDRRGDATSETLPVRLRIETSSGGKAGGFGNVRVGLPRIRFSHALSQHLITNAKTLG